MDKEKNRSIKNIFIKCLFVLSIFVTVACTPSKELLGIYPIKQVKVVETQDTYDVFYIINFTKNVKKYSVSYYEKSDNKWKYVGTVSGKISKKARKQAERSVGVQEDFQLFKKVPIKIEVVAYNSVKYGHTITHEHTFDLW